MGLFGTVPFRDTPLVCRHSLEPAGRHAQDVWGEAFAEDSLSDIARVSNWDLCSQDEYLRLFPRLVPRDDRIAPAVVERLTECLAVYAWRARTAGRNQGSDVRFLTQASIDRLGARHEPSWFSRRSPTRRVSPQGDRARRTAEQAFSELLDGLLLSQRQGIKPSADEDRASIFAYHSGVHPAYVWPQQALSSTRSTAAGWLGVLNRGRAAFMLPDVAEYLVDVIDPRSMKARDELIDRMIPGAEAADLRSAATRMLDGASTIVRFRRP